MFLFIIVFLSIILGTPEMSDAHLNCNFIEH